MNSIQNYGMTNYQYKNNAVSFGNKEKLTRIASDYASRAKKLDNETNRYVAAHRVESGNNNVNKNEISDAQMDASLSMLKKKISFVMSDSKINDLENYIDAIGRKWKTGSVGVKFIPDEMLKNFFDGVVKINKQDLKDRVGICVAAGDKYGPVEIWSKAYETIVALVPKEEFELNFSKAFVVYRGQFLH